jgi:CpeT protein
MLHASPDLHKFASWLQGTYTTTAEAKADTSRNDVTLRIVPIWPQKTDAYWFYVEQAMTYKQEKPYRTAVLRISELNGNIESKNYKLPHKEFYYGAWKDPSSLSGRITDTSIAPDAVCSIYFQRKNRRKFKGGTGDAKCPNTRKGASYFTNECYLTKSVFYSWDRGWSQEGKVVWGPEDRGYEFIKVKP